MRDIESHFKRKKKFAISILLLMVAAWGVFSFYIIFIRLGWGDVSRKLRITKDLEDISKARKPAMIHVLCGWPTASSRETVDLGAVTRKLEQECRPEFQKLFNNPPYLKIRRFPAWKRNCYIGLDVIVYPENGFKSEIPTQEGFKKSLKLLNSKLNEMFPQNVSYTKFYNTRPLVVFKGNKLELGSELKDVKIPKKLRIMFIGRGGQPGMFVFTAYPDMWDVKYDSSSAELAGAERITRRKEACIIEIPVENGQGEQYRMLVRVENK